MTDASATTTGPTITFDFTGKVAIVTGSAGGIGQAYAEALADAGASVVVADIDIDKAEAVAAGIRNAGGQAIGVAVDVADPASAEAMAAAAVDAFGGIDYLVNNAAIFGGMKLDLLLTVDWEYLNRFLSVNMLGALNCVRACYPAMKARGGGAVVNQSSTAAYMYAGFYGLAKAGGTRSPSRWPTNSAVPISGPTPSHPVPSTPRRRATWCPTSL